jgi:hypothetical protein
MEKREFRIVVIRIADGGGAGVGWSTPGLDKKKSPPSGGSYVRLLADGLDPRRCRYASVLPRLPHTRIEHHRPGPLREVWWNTQRQSGTAHIFSCRLLPRWLPGGSRGRDSTTCHRERRGVPSVPNSMRMLRPARVPLALARPYRSPPALVARASHAVAL